MKHYYTAVYSKDYAYKGVVLYNSLLTWDNDFELFLVCLHDEVKNLYEIMNMNKATIISIDDVERYDPGLKRAKSTRNEKEYAWTVKASIMLYVLDHFEDTDHIVWLDGDSQFLSDPEPIFSEWGSSSILLTEERWSDYDQYLVNVFGKYNLGFIGFKEDAYGMECLTWYRDRIIEWCFDRHENGKWADQPYANDWVDRFNGVHVLQNIGVNLNPYICRSCKITEGNDGLYANGDKIIFYHFYGFKYFDGNEFDLCGHINPLYDSTLKLVYKPYIDSCIKVIAEIRKIDCSFYTPIKPKDKFIRNYYNLSYNNSVGETDNQFCTIFNIECLTQGLALYKSLKMHTPQFHLWILCVDKLTYQVLEQMKLDKVTLLSLENINDEKLSKVGIERTVSEHCWTLKPALLDYILKNHWQLKSMILLDAELYFIKDASLLFQDWGDGSLYLTEMGLGPNWVKKVGRYSSGVVGVKRDDVGKDCLAFWYQKCLDWCYDKFEDNRWRDQKYLEEWSNMAETALVVSSNPGINVGPWNIKRGKLYSQDAAYYFKDSELISYNFSGFEIISDNTFDLCNRKPLPSYSSGIYSAYAQEISRIIKCLRIKAGGPSLLAKITKKMPHRYFNKFCIK